MRYLTVEEETSKSNVDTQILRTASRRPAQQTFDTLRCGTPLAHRTLMSSLEAQSSCFRQAEVSSRPRVLLRLVVSATQRLPGEWEVSQ